jgi:uncharacterized protein YjdB
MRRLLSVFLLLNILSLAGCGGSSSKTSTTTPPPNGQVTLQSITVAPANATIAQGTTQAFTATGNYSDGSTKDLTASVQWACLLPNLATVSNSSPTQGLAIAQPNVSGTVVISAAMGSMSNNGVLNITQATVSSIAVTPTTAEIGFGNQQQFKAVATFSDQTTQDVTNLATWSSFPPFITTNSGLAIGQQIGASGISATFQSSGSATLNVDSSNIVSVAIVPANPSIANHTTTLLSAIGTFTDGSTRDVSGIVTWSSANPAVANFGITAGQITGTSAGTSMITATINDPNATTPASGSTTLTVTGATLQSLTLLPVNASFPATTKFQLSGIGTFSDSTTQDLSAYLTWTSSNTAIGTVTSKGLVNGLSAGSVTITATSSFNLNHLQASVPVNVTSATLSSLAVSPASALLVPAATLDFSAIGTFSDGSTQNATSAAAWTSSSTNVATVPSAVATGQGFGQTTITAKLGSISTTSILSVVNPSQFTIAITPASLQIAAQTSSQLTATGTFVDGTTQDLTSQVAWSSSAPNVTTVGYQTGMVSGLTSGQSTITATLGSVTSTTALTVTGATLSSITVLPASPSIPLGASQQFTATGNFSDGSTQSLVGVTWASSNTAVAVVNSSGSASSTATGTATITVTLNGVSGNTTLTVQ